MCPVDEELFLLEDYKLKLAYLNAHSDRMWTRFNYFVTIEAALLAVFAVANAGTFKQRAHWAALAAFVTSVVWWTVGARDRFLWRAGRRNVDRAASRLRVGGDQLVGYRLEPLRGYISVGELDPFADTLRAVSLERHRPAGFRVLLGFWGGAQDSAVGVTFIPMLLPAVASALWWGLFIGFLAHHYSNPWLAFIALAPVGVAMVLWAGLAAVRKLRGHLAAPRILWADACPGNNAQVIWALQNCAISVVRVTKQEAFEKESKKPRRREGHFRAAVIAPGEGREWLSTFEKVKELIESIKNDGDQFKLRAKPKTDTQAKAAGTLEPIPIYLLGGQPKLDAHNEELCRMGVKICEREGLVDKLLKLTPSDAKRNRAT